MAKASTSKRVWEGNRQLNRMLVPIDSLASHPDNPRRHDLPAIMESLERFGQQRPIIVVPPGRVDVDRSTIIAGHGTTAAAAELGWTHIARLESELSDDEIERFVLADNRSSDRASYDDEVLARLLTEVDDRGGLDGTLYDRADLDGLLRDLRQRERRGRDAESIPPVPESVDSEVGGRYELGPHVLVCGDAFDADTRVELMAGVGVGCALMDPPYGIDLDTDFSKRYSRGTGRTYRKVIGDDQPFDPTDLVTALDHVAEQFWFGANYYRRTLSPSDYDGSWLVWDKRTPETDVVVGSGFELIWSRQHHKQDVLRSMWTNYTSQYNAGLRREHPTEKPVALVREVLERWAPEGKAVIDLFAGAGSTLIAAEQLGLSCLVLEIDPAYCDVIRARYAAFTA